MVTLFAGRTLLKRTVAFLFMRGLKSGSGARILMQVAHSLSRRLVA